MHPMSRELSSSSMTNLNSLLNQHQISSLQEQQLLHHGQPPMQSFDPTSSHEDFLEQFLSSVPSSAPTFPWSDEPLMQQQQMTSNGKAAALMQQHLLMSRGLLSPDHNDIVDASSFKNSNNNQGNDEQYKALFNGFNGSIGQTSNQTPQFNTPQGGAMPTMSQPAVSGSSGGGTAGQPRQRVRARRGQATDPHSIAERLRRERIAERMKGLQELVPNANKTDKASMLDEIIDYVKFLQLQVKVLSMSRLGGAAAVAPLVADMSSEGRNGKSTKTASSSNNNDGMTVAENQVAKLMEEDMGSAMQYLQGKGLCLMPISLATAISTSTGQTRNPLNANGDVVGPTSPIIPGMNIQSAKGAKPPSKN